VELVDERRHVGADAGAMRPIDQRVDRREVALRDALARGFVAAVAALGDARRVDQLIGDALKRRYDDDDGVRSRGFKYDAPDGADAIRGRQRRPAKLEDLHDGAQYISRFDQPAASRDPDKPGLRRRA